MTVPFTTAGMAVGEFAFERVEEAAGIEPVRLQVVEVHQLFAWPGHASIPRGVLGRGGCVGV